jgi:hypothetical protein
MSDSTAQHAWVARVLGVEVPPTGATGGTPDDRQEPRPGVVAYRKLLLEWDTAKKRAGSQIAGFQQAVLKDYPDLAKAAGQLDQVMQRFNEGLADALDGAISAENGAEEDKFNRRAVEIAQRYFLMVKADPLFRHIDENPLAALTVRATIGDTLKKLLAGLPN